MHNNICLRIIPVVAFALFGACMGAEPEDDAVPEVSSRCLEQGIDPADCHDEVNPDRAALGECRQVDQWCANSCEPDCGWALWDWDLYYRCVSTCNDSCCVLWER